MEITTTIIWAAGIIAFVVLEALTYQLVSIWFALGAVGAIIASAFNATFTVQMIVFLIISVVFLLCLRPLSLKMLKHEEVKTNVDTLIGREVIITQEIDNLKGTGEGRVNGMTWSVRSDSGINIPVNTIAVIKKIEGVKLIVTKKEND